MEIISKKTPKNIPGIYGAAKKYRRIGQPFVHYIGRSNDTRRRCITDHQKPSQDLAQKIVHDVTSKWRHQYEKEGNIREYDKIAKALLEGYEFILIKDFSHLENSKHLEKEMKNYERVMIDHYQPKLNINYKNI